MNNIFQLYVCNSVLIFFVYVVVYSSSLDYHLSKLQLGFTILEVIYERAKYSFAMPKVQDLDHIIVSIGCMVAKPSQLQAMINWQLNIRCDQNHMVLFGQLDTMTNS